jgi:hypothetical protein
MAGIVGPTKAAEFQTAWANHVEGLMDYTAAVAGNDQAAKTTAKQNLDGFAERLDVASHFSGAFSSTGTHLDQAVLPV